MGDIKISAKNYLNYSQKKTTQSAIKTEVMVED